MGTTAHIRKTVKCRGHCLSQIRELTVESIIKETVYGSNRLC